MQSKRALSALVAFILAPPAFAENTADALKTFGLIGTWSRDCAKDPTKDGERSTYAVPLFGAPTITVIRPHHLIEHEIRSAVRATEDKIKVVDVITKTTTDGQNQDLLPAQVIPIETVIIKTNNKIRLVDSARIDGSAIWYKDGFSVYYNSDLKKWINEGETKPEEKCLH
jgi:hypothetical protein